MAPQGEILASKIPAVREAPNVSLGYARYLKAIQEQRGMSLAAPENDYLSNLKVVEKFPWCIYHRPIRRAVQRVITAQEANRGRLSILNVGCGLSQVLKYIPEIHYYHGLDIDERAVQICRRLFRSREKVEFDLAGGYDLPVEDGRFDVVFATEVVEHVLEPERWLAELVRSANAGGAVQLSTPNYGDWVLPLIEKTVLEWIARRQGFTRKGLHPTPFDRHSLQHLMEDAGLVNVKVYKTPLSLALIGTGYKPFE